MTIAGGLTIELGDILKFYSILLIYDFPFVIVWIWFLFWLIPLILSLSNLSCISFNLVSIGVASCIFDFAAFIGIIKGCSKVLTDDDDDDKVEKKFEEKFDFDDVSPILSPEAEENKNWEILLSVDSHVEENDLYNLIVVEFV